MQFAPEVVVLECSFLNYSQGILEARLDMAMICKMLDS
jgi:hypothetical protein